jgi:hypothetical protein
VRLHSNRAFYADPEEVEKRLVGRPRRHGKKFVLPDPETWPEPAHEYRRTTEDYGEGRVRAWPGLHPKTRCIAERYGCERAPVVRDTVDSRHLLLGEHPQASARGVDRLRGDGAAPGDGAGCLRSDDRSRSVRRGRGLLHTNWGIAGVAQALLTARFTIIGLIDDSQYARSNLWRPERLSPRALRSIRPPRRPWCGLPLEAGCP